MFQVPHFRELRPESLKVPGMGLQLCGLQIRLFSEKDIIQHSGIILVKQRISRDRHSRVGSVRLEGSCYGAAVAFFGFLVAGLAWGPREESVRSVGRLAMWCSLHFIGSSRW
ncbi:hypothetical protein Taro_034077 [Colocasia esculenta]|uniref:Uncharacterized protein n=1 Tax=Colocasia esculenta TaxID=4460 RepID=A0A843VVI1_COLES|nr:hypothetical protein [Colocasia esculenta]